MAEYYVNKSGDDTNSGASHDEAFATINYAVGTAANGDTIYVGSGVYEENISIGSGFNKTLYLMADGYAVMDGASIGGNAFTAVNFSNFSL